MARLFNQEFRNEQSESLYPFSDRATLTADTGISFERDTFLDASIHPIGDYEQLRIASIEIDVRSVTIEIGDRRNNGIASGEFDPTVPPEVLRITDRLGRDAGMLIAEENALASFAAWPSGTHVFDVEAAEFVASCCHPVPSAGAGLLGFELPDGTFVSGDLWMVGDRGVMIAANSVDNRSEIFSEDSFYEHGKGDMLDNLAPVNAIMFSVVGDSLFKYSSCAKAAAAAEESGADAPAFLTNRRRFLKTINYIPPDEFGRWQFMIREPDGGHSILRIQRSGKQKLEISLTAKPMAS